MVGVAVGGTNPRVSLLFGQKVHVSPTGGELLFIEATAMPGQKGLTLTGQLGDVMKESAQIAVSYVKAHSQDLGIDLEAIDPRRHARKVSRRFFSAVEADWLASQPRDRFFMLWVLKEAYGKATGAGVVAAFQGLQCLVEPPRIDVLESGVSDQFVEIGDMTEVELDVAQRRCEFRHAARIGDEKTVGRCRELGVCVDLLAFVVLGKRVGGEKCPNIESEVHDARIDPHCVLVQPRVDEFDCLYSVISFLLSF